MEQKVFTSVVDSGVRQQFDTGSKRDTDIGKGNPHLIPASFYKALLVYSEDRENFQGQLSHSYYELLENALNNFSEDITADHEKTSSYLVPYLIAAFDYAALMVNSESYVKSKTSALRRLSIHYQNGAAKYDKNNWRKGQPISRYFDSTKRHLWSFLEGKTDEDHLAAVLWNIAAMVVTIYDVENGVVNPELFDFPFNRKDLSSYVARD